MTQETEDMNCALCGADNVQLEIMTTRGWKEYLHSERDYYAPQEIGVPLCNDCVARYSRVSSQSAGRGVTDEAEELLDELDLDELVNTRP